MVNIANTSLYRCDNVRPCRLHLGLSEEAKSKRERTPPHPDFVETVMEPYDDGWPDYEEPFVDVEML